MSFWEEPKVETEQVKKVEISNDDAINNWLKQSGRINEIRNLEKKDKQNEIAKSILDWEINNSMDFNNLFSSWDLGILLDSSRLSSDLKNRLWDLIIKQINKLLSVRFNSDIILADTWVWFWKWWFWYSYWAWENSKYYEVHIKPWEDAIIKFYHLVWDIEKDLSK